QFVDVARGEDGVAVLRLDRPPANALSVAVLGEIAEAARGLTADPPGAVVVTGGDKIFAAGADIAEFGGPEEAARISGHFREALNLGRCVRIFPAAVLQAEARVMALSFATGAVAAHALAKRAIDAALHGSLADGISLEQELFVQAFETDDAKIGVKSFLENG